MYMRSEGKTSDFVSGDLWDEFMSPPASLHSNAKIGSVAKIKGGLMKRDGLVVSMNNKSILFFDDQSGQEIHVPYSEIADWHFTESGGKENLRLSDLNEGDAVCLMLPCWLCKKEGLEK
jgi:hypothetical protein